MDGVVWNDIVISGEEVVGTNTDTREIHIPRSNLIKHVKHRRSW